MHRVGAGRPWTWGPSCCIPQLRASQLLLPSCASPPCSTVHTCPGAAPLFTLTPCRKNPAATPHHGVLTGCSACCSSRGPPTGAELWPNLDVGGTHGWEPHASRLHGPMSQTMSLTCPWLSWGLGFFISKMESSFQAEAGWKSLCKVSAPAATHSSPGWWEARGAGVLSPLSRCGN